MVHRWVVNHHEKKATTCQSISQYDFRNKTDFRSTWRIAICALSGPHISMLGFIMWHPSPLQCFRSLIIIQSSHLFKAEIKLLRVNQIRHFCYQLIGLLEYQHKPAYHCRMKFSQLSFEILERSPYRTVYSVYVSTRYPAIALTPTKKLHWIRLLFNHKNDNTGTGVFCNGIKLYYVMNSKG